MIREGRGPDQTKLAKLERVESKLREPNQEIKGAVSTIYTLCQQGSASEEGQRRIP